MVKREEKKTLKKGVFSQKKAFFSKKKAFFYKKKGFFFQVFFEKIFLD